MTMTMNHPESKRITAVVASSALFVAAIVIATSLTQETWKYYLSNALADRRRLAGAVGDQLPGIFPLRWPQSYLGFGCAILGLMLAAGGGIGGGGILVPVYTLVLHFPVKYAIPLSAVTVFGGAIANNVLNVQKFHPNHPNRPAIDWDLMLLLVPATIAGALVGAVIEKMLPEILLLVLMLLLLTVTARETLTKAMKMYREEEKKLAQGGGNSSSNNNNNKNGSVTESTPLFDKLPAVGGDVETQSNGTNIDFERQAIKAQCINDALKLVSLFAVVAFIDILHQTPANDGGSGEGGSLIGQFSCGTTCYWVSEALLFLGILLFTLIVRAGILKRQESGGPILSDIHWNERNTTIYPLLSTLAGLAAGMFGIGGGMVTAPLMLALGVHPQVSSATSACMILFTSSTSALCFLIFGYLKSDYAIFCLVIGFISTLIGQTVMSALLGKTGRSSYITFCIGGVIAISAVAMGVQSALAIFQFQL
ncbi:hypothetical protein ACHAXH_002102 [Discostella pseudostelligera]